MTKMKDNTEVQNYSFASFQDKVLKNPGQVSAFELKSFENTRTKIDPSTIRSEREYAAKNSFEIDKIVRDYRGLSGQEQQDLENRIRFEVEERLKIVREEAYQEGLEKGRGQGEKEAFDSALTVHQTQIDDVALVLEHVKKQCDEMLLEHKHSIYEFSKRMLKWLVLKETKEDQYIDRLLEKLILEMNQRHNLIIRVNQDAFKLMPQVLTKIQEKLGELSNVRVEMDHEIKDYGIILETENGLIHGTTEALFEAIDKMYESVVGHA